MIFFYNVQTYVNITAVFSGETSFVSFSGFSFDSCAYSSLRNCPTSCPALFAHTSSR